MSETRQDILNLLSKEELSVQELAHRLGITVAGVRQHVTALEAQGLLARRKRVTQPSRPTYLYRLSEQGQRARPKRYDLLARELLHWLQERQGPAAVAEAVQASAARLAGYAEPRLRDPDPQAQWQHLLAWLEEELAWGAEVAGSGPGWRRILIRQCPFQDVAAQQPAVCGLFLRGALQPLYGAVSVEPVPPQHPVACCCLLLRTQAPQT